MMKLLTTTVLFLLILSCRVQGRPSTSEQTKKQEPQLKLLIEVLEYLPNDLHTQVEGQPDKWNDSSRVKILAGADEKKELVIHHNIPAIEESFWRKKGVQLEIKLPRKFLYPEKGTSFQIYTDALEIVRILDETEHVIHREIESANYFVNQSRKSCGLIFREKPDREPAKDLYWQRNYYCDNCGVYLRVFLFHDQKKALDYAKEFVDNIALQEKKTEGTSRPELLHRWTVNGALLYIARGVSEQQLICLMSLFAGEE